MNYTKTHTPQHARETRTDIFGNTYNDYPDHLNTLTTTRPLKSLFKQRYTSIFANTELVALAPNGGIYHNKTDDILFQPTIQPLPPLSEFHSQTHPSETHYTPTRPDSKPTVGTPLFTHKQTPSKQLHLNTHNLSVTEALTQFRPHVRDSQYLQSTPEITTSDLSTPLTRNKHI